MADPLVGQKCTRLSSKYRKFRNCTFRLFSIVYCKFVFYCLLLLIQIYPYSLWADQYDLRSSLSMRIVIMYVCSIILCSLNCTMYLCMCNCVYMYVLYVYVYVCMRVKYVTLFVINFYLTHTLSQNVTHLRPFPQSNVHHTFKIEN